MLDPLAIWPVLKRSSRQRLPLFMLLAVVAFVSGPAVAGEEKRLPPRGTTSWEIQIPAEIVTFALVDPRTLEGSLPNGLSFIRAREVQNPSVRESLNEHLTQYPQHTEWAFSYIEIVRMEDLVIDGRAPMMPDNGAIGVWIAPVNASRFAEAIPDDRFASVIGDATGSRLQLGFWIPDREYVAYMLDKGHYAEYGMVTLVEESTGIVQGEIRLDDLYVTVSAKPEEEVRQDDSSFTLALLPPGDEVEGAVIVAASEPRHQTCDAEWSTEGTHPLAGAVLFGPTFLTSYETATKARGYRFREQAKH